MKKLTLTPKKLQANRENAALGGLIWSIQCTDKYNSNPSYCQHCNSVLPQNKKRNKFCSKSCSAKFNNKGVRRHGQGPGLCKVCNKPNKDSNRLFCSKECTAVYKKGRTKTGEKIEDLKSHIRAINAASQSKYRAKQYRTIDPTADKQKIKEIYENCPEGYEVDHIILLSKGGRHHEDNLQYLPWRENRSKGNKLVEAERLALP